LDECLSSVVKGEAVTLTLSRFNELMLHHRRHPVSAAFFEYFFSQATTLDLFDQAVEHFRRVAMLVYGSFKQAHRRLGSIPDSELLALLHSRVEPVEWPLRPAFGDIEEIADDDLWLLGYVSGRQYLRALRAAVAFLTLIVEAAGHSPDVWVKLPAAQVKPLSDALKSVGHSLEATRALPGGDPSVRDIRDAANLKLREFEARWNTAVSAGLRNTQRYLAADQIDVYVATTMRDAADYQAQRDFIREVFGHPDVRDLNLRFFDPTLSYVESRIEKGLVESLMIKRAKVTIYSAGEKDSLGKDSELASTLAQGKPVIVFVPEGGESLDKRATIFRTDHPLGLQVDVRTGVAHGIIVVRSPSQCARLLRKVLTRRLAYDQIEHEDGTYKLVESETKSVVRVVSDDEFLTHAFWTYFHPRDRA
jgi:hypothetical protein